MASNLQSSRRPLPQPPNIPSHPPRATDAGEQKILDLALKCERLFLDLTQLSALSIGGVTLGTSIILLEAGFISIIANGSFTSYPSAIWNSSIAYPLIAVAFKISVAVTLIFASTTALAVGVKCIICLLQKRDITWNNWKWLDLNHPLKNIKW